MGGSAVGGILIFNTKNLFYNRVDTVMTAMEGLV